MNKDKVLEFFEGSSHKVAAALGISRQAVEKWPKLVPKGSAADIEKVTRGKLKYNPADYRKARGQ